MDPYGTFFALSDLGLGSDLFEVDEKLLGVVLGVSKELGRVEGENVVGNDIWRFGQKVGIV